MISSCSRLALLGAAEAHQLHLVELVHADQPARVLARRTRLAAEAGRAGATATGSAAAVEDLVAVDVGDRHLGRRDEVEVVRADVVQLVGELGQLPGAGHRGAGSPGNGGATST